MTEPRQVRLAIMLPEPPSANRWWRMGRSGKNGGDHHMHLSAVARAYKRDVYSRVLVHLANTHSLPASFSTPLIRAPEPVAIEFVWWRSRKSGDLDKRLGVVLDALQGTVYEADSQVVKITAERRDDPKMQVGLWVVVP